jgi:hypothetical protein
MAVEIVGEADQKHRDHKGEDNSASVRVTLLKRLKREHVTFCRVQARRPPIDDMAPFMLLVHISSFSLSLLLHQWILYEADLASSCSSLLVVSKLINCHHGETWSTLRVSPFTSFV